MDTRSIAGAALLALIILDALAAAAAAQAAPAHGPRWLRPGVEASYFVIVATKKGAGHAGATSQALTSIVLYTILGVDGQRVSYEKLEVHPTLLGESPNAVMRDRAVTAAHSGPFWMDPGRLREARPGDRVPFETGEGKAIELSVVKRAVVDVSAFSTSANSLARQGVPIVLPAPPGTLREVLILAGEPERGKRVEFIVDAEMGLVYYAGYTEKAGKGITTSMMVLAGINVDLEDKLPSYLEGRYDYGPLVRPGYAFRGTWLYVSIEASFMVSLTSYIAGMYKGRLVVLELIFVSTPQSSTLYSAWLYEWLVDVEKRKAALINQTSVLPGAQLLGPGDVPLLAAPLASSSPVVTIYGNQYRGAGGNYRPTGQLSSPIYFTSISYNDAGLLENLQPSYGGVALQAATAPATTKEYLAAFPHMRPQHPAPAHDTEGQGAGAEGGGEKPAANNIVIPVLPAVGGARNETGKGSNGHNAAAQGGHAAASNGQTGSQGTGSSQHSANEKDSMPLPVHSGNEPSEPAAAWTGRTTGPAEASSSSETAPAAVENTASPAATETGDTAGLYLSLASSAAILAAALLYSRKAAR